MRVRRVVAVVGVLLGMGLAAGPASAYSVSYDQKITHGNDAYAGKVSMKDGLFRMEMTMDGQETIILKNADGMFTVMPSEGMAMKTPHLRPGQGPVQGAEDYAGYLAGMHAEKTGTETIDGHPCDIYRYIDPQTGGHETVWVWTEKMFPIRIESENTNGKTLTELSNIQIGAALPDSTFKLPDGVQVMDMSALMGMGRPQQQ